MQKHQFFVFFFNDEKMFINDVFKLKKCTRQRQISLEENVVWKCFNLSYPDTGLDGILN